MRRPELDLELTQYLEDAAASAGTDINTLLRRILNVGPVADSQQSAPYLIKLSTVVKDLLDEVDHSIRVLNPGLHRVFRESYIAYRRPSKVGEGPKAERSLTFVSLRPRRKGIAAILPLDPRSFAGHPAVKDLTAVGHHGVGDLQYEISDAAAIADFLSTFAAWLRAD